jgi:hypothetical protein
MLNERFGDLLPAAMDRENPPLPCGQCSAEPDAREALASFPAKPEEWRGVMGSRAVPNIRARTGRGDPARFFRRPARDSTLAMDLG